MNYIIFNICILFLPIAIYLINIAYNNNYQKKYDQIFLSVILVIQCVLFFSLKNYSQSLILINIPLLISYLKRYALTSIILSIFIVFYYIIQFQYNPFFVFFEYTLYFVINYIINHKMLKLNLLIYIFIFIKSMILSIETFYFNLVTETFIITFLGIVLKMLLFYIISYLVFIFLLRGEEIMNLNTAMKELEKEKVLRTSLFKITHEIKNPIAVCKGYLDMLDLKNQQKIDKYIPIIKGEIERTLSLMDDYLEYTKIQVHKDLADIYMLLEEVINSLNLFFKENNIILKINIPDDELFLNIDYNRIKQVLVNILKNSKEAFDNKKGEMVIKVTTKVSKKNFQIIIEDNGIGMDSDTLNQIDNLFFTTKKNGTGLGISLSKEIMELHGGKIKYYSTLGLGTMVILSFPLDKNVSLISEMETAQI